MSDLQATVAAEQARPLPAAGIAAVVDALWPGATVTSLERLLGGLGAAIHRLEVRTADGAADTVILRLFLAAYGDGPEVAEREYATLTALAAAGAAAPAPRWLDASGAVLGRPALAMSVVPGRPMVSDRSIDVTALARALVEIHRTPLEGFGHLAPPAPLDVQARAWVPPGTADVGTFVDADRLLAEIARWAASARPAAPALVHGDFHPGNVLTDGERTTVVDWTWPVLGDPGRDLGYCRYDLTLGYGRDVAERFTAAYVAEGGVARPSPHWDLVAVTASLPTPAQWLRAFVELGRDDRTADGFEAAGRDFMADAFARLR